MRTTAEIRAWAGCELVGRDGSTIGKIAHVYVDRQSGEPTFVAVTTGLFGRNVSLVPIEAAQMRDGAVEVPFDKGQVKGAPNVDADAELTEREEQRLYEHYGLSYSPYEGPDHETMGREREGRFHREGREGETREGSADDAMTRSEEELHVGTRSRETGRARLRKYVVTENVEQTVPVAREELRVEREPITDANREQALSGPEITESEHEVVLHAEEPVVEKRMVPKERIRMEKDTVTGEETVSDEVRKERIETDTDH